MRDVVNGAASAPVVTLTTASICRLHGPQPGRWAIDVDVDLLPTADATYDVGPIARCPPGHLTLTRVCPLIRALFIRVRVLARPRPRSGMLSCLFWPRHGYRPTTRARADPTR